jgi:uncharacterized protein YkwD
LLCAVRDNDLFARSEIARSSSNVGHQDSGCQNIAYSVTSIVMRPHIIDTYFAPLFFLATLILLPTAHAQQLGEPPRAFVPQTQSTTKAATPRLDRASVVSLYHTLFLPTESVVSGWAGNVGGCVAGTTSPEFKQAVVDRANYYRALAGLPSNLAVLGDARSTDDQNAALVFSANGSLSHAIPTTWLCYSDSAANGASHSNIALGLTGVDAVDAYMDDAGGGGNAAVGHRRWILYPPQVGFGTGDVPYSQNSATNALWIAGDNWSFGTRAPTPNGVAWPPQGYVPWDLLPGVSNRWSFSYPNADFSTATASVTPSGGAPLALAYEGLQTGFGDNTFVFLPQGFSYGRPEEDRRYSVQVAGVSGSGIPASFAYDVTVIDAERIGADMTADLDGDHRDDIVWRNARTGQTAAWLMNGTSSIASAILFTDPSWAVTHVADFNADGKADLLWRNRATGQVALWMMDGLTTLGSAILFTDPQWMVTNVADLNGDHRADLVWRNESTGQTAVWLMNGTAVLASAIVFGDAAWSVTHAADFNGDGKADLVWRNRTTGQTAIWLMDGTVALDTKIVFGDGNWAVTNTADTNGDGFADLIWRNRTTGQTALWLMNGATPMASAILSTGGAGWRVVQTGDFDGDGKVDLFWRNATTGQSAIWLMNGLATQSSAIVFTSDDWQPAKTGNFDGNLGSTEKPKHDVLWRNSRAGQYAVWLMNGLAPTQTAAILDGAAWWAMP